MKIRYINKKSSFKKLVFSPMTLFILHNEKGSGKNGCKHHALLIFIYVIYDNYQYYYTGINYVKIVCKLLLINNYIIFFYFRKFF